MKHYLLTWYGITDLRAALGFEEAGGPVLGALKTGGYTDVLVLAYTNPGKVGQEITQTQRAWIELISTAVSGSLHDFSRSQQDEIVDAFSNTPAGHTLYNTWLIEEIGKLGLTVRVRMCVKELSFLNDSKGIYEAASQVLDIAVSEAEERNITFYLSPGTPVMAFTWAFLALTNPDFNIKVIACPDYRKPPEEIQVPYDLLAPSNRKARPASLISASGFDVIFHLFGEQRMPSIFGVLQFPCPHHVFITSDKYPSEIMRQFIPAEEKYDQICVNAFDPMSVKLAVLKAVAGMQAGSRVGFNLTGGTKLMFAGAIAACRKVRGIPFYFETRDHNLLFLHDFTTLPMRGVDSVDVFFQANGFSVIRPGKWADNPCRKQRITLTNKLWRERWLIAKTYKQLVAYADFMEDDFQPFSIRQEVNNRGQVAVIEISLDESGRARLNLNGAEYIYPYCPDFAKYLAGGWLEEFAYLTLEPLLQQGKIRDLRIGLEVSWERRGAEEEQIPAQEFDVALTDGKRLLIIECKAGAVLSDHVHKLQNSVRNYGGVDARGILVSAFPPHHSVTRRKLADAANLRALDGWDVSQQLQHLVLST